MCAWAPAVYFINYLSVFTGVHCICAPGQRKRECPYSGGDSPYTLFLYSTGGQVAKRHQLITALLSRSHSCLSSLRSYVNPTNVRLLDHQFVVDAILFFNARILEKAVIDNLPVGGHVSQVGHTHGTIISCISLCREMQLCPGFTFLFNLQSLFP